MNAMNYLFSRCRITVCIPINTSCNASRRCNVAMLQHWHKFQLENVFMSAVSRLMTPCKTVQKQNLKPESLTQQLKLNLKLKPMSIPEQTKRNSTRWPIATAAY